MNGKPPGKEEAGTDENAASNPPAPTSETVEQPHDTVTEAVDETEQARSESLADQVQDLRLNEPPVQDTSSAADDVEETEEVEEDDGDGEWISSLPLAPGKLPPLTHWHSTEQHQKVPSAGKCAHRAATRTTHPPSSSDHRGYGHAKRRPEDKPEVRVPDQLQVDSVADLPKSSRLRFCSHHLP